MSESVANSIYRLVRQVPTGRVTTYGAIASALKLPSPRQVGYWLHRNSRPDTIACHRVVRADGRLAKNFAFGGLGGQTNKLLAEGVPVKAGRVNLIDYVWADFSLDAKSLKRDII